jgi:hypothetical protein
MVEIRAMLPKDWRLRGQRLSGCYGHSSAVARALCTDQRRHSMRSFQPSYAHHCWLSTVRRPGGLRYHLHDVSMATEILDWLRITYVFESWCP